MELNNWVDKYKQYIGRFDPNFFSDFEAASSEKVLQLQKFVGRQLPTEYQDFLKLMGEKPKHALGNIEADFSINEVLDCYLESKNNSDAYPLNYLLIACGSGLFLNELCIPLAPNEEGTHPITLTVDESIGNILSSSIAHLLLQEAFSLFEMKEKKFKKKFEFNKKEIALLRIREVCSQLGFSYRDFSDDYNLCAFHEKNDTSFQARVCDMRLNKMRLAGNNKEFTEEVAKALSEGLGINCSE